MTTDLTQIAGIGPNSAKDLSEAGFDTIEAIASSTPETLGKVSGFGPKRAARVIASARELTEDVEVTPVVEPAVVAAQSRPRMFFASAAVLLLLVAAIVYFGYQNETVNLAPLKTAQQDTAGVDSEQGTMTYGQETMNGSGRAGTVTMAGQSSMAPGQEPVSNTRRPVAVTMPAMAGQQAEPEWVSRQRAQADMYRAQAEKYRQESWNRFVSSLPPAQAEQVTRQHAMAMKQMEESQRRQAAMIQQHNAYINRRFGS